MELKVTVALGKSPFWGSRLERLLNVLQRYFPDEVEMEQPQNDDYDRWSYTFIVKVESVGEIKRILHKNGRFKAVKIIDNDSGEAIWMQSVK